MRQFLAPVLVVALGASTVAFAAQPAVVMPVRTVKTVQTVGPAASVVDLRAVQLNALEQQLAEQGEQIKALTAQVATLTARCNALTAQQAAWKPLMDKYPVHQHPLAGFMIPAKKLGCTEPGVTDATMVPAAQTAGFGQPFVTKKPNP